MFHQKFLEHSLSFLTPQEKEAFIHQSQEVSPISIRYNTHKPVPVASSLRPVPWCRSGYFLDEKPVFTLDPLFHAGAYYVQEASSMSIEQFVNLVELPDDAIVLDLCAAPGGKSTHLLSLLKDSQLLVSNEVIKTRIAPLKENLIKWGCENMVITQNDSEHFEAVTDFFDMILVDAPCSGEGMFRKEPNAIKEWSPENVEICYKRQRRILAEITPSLKEGGYLIYSTCTYNAKEDEDNVQWFLENYDYEEIKLPYISSGVMECKYGYKYIPSKIQGEGFYICCLRKKGSLAPFEFYKSKHSNLDVLKDLSEVGALVKRDTELGFYIFQDTVKVLHPKHKIAVDYLSKRLNIITAGLDLAERLKNKQVIPLHSLAVSRLLNKEVFAPIALDKNEALRFLKKELNDIACDNGVHIATYMDTPLGFFKKIQNRINNNYPQEWRIRMNLP